MKISNLQLEWDRIKKFEYQIDDEIIGKKLTPKLKLEVQHNFLEKTNDNPYRATLLLKYNVRFKEGKKIYLKMNIELEGSFIGNPKLDDTEFKKLVIHSGILNLIQITRAKVTAISANFGFIQPIYLPMIDATDLVNKKMKEVLGE